MAKIAQQVYELAMPITEEAGLELVDVEFVKEGGSWYLRIFIDKPSGITFDDCQIVSKKLDKLLDEKDYIKQAYMLEVSSPGIERPLKNENDFVRFAGCKINISFFKAFNGKKKICAELSGFNAEDNIIEVITDDGIQLSIPGGIVSSVKLAADI